MDTERLEERLICEICGSIQDHVEGSFAHKARWKRQVRRVSEWADSIEALAAPPSDEEVERAAKVLADFFHGNSDISSGGVLTAARLALEAARKEDR